MRKQVLRRKIVFLVQISREFRRVERLRGLKYRQAKDKGATILFLGVMANID